MQQNVTSGGGGQQFDCSLKNTLKKQVLGGVLAFFVFSVFCFGLFLAILKLNVVPVLASWTDTGIYATSFAGGDGSEENPYKIATPAQLGRFSALFWDTTNSNYSYYRAAHYCLTADIDLSGNVWSPIGRTNTGLIPGSSSVLFSGSFDGQGHTISNITGTSNYGDNGPYLFGGLGGTCKNVVVENGTLVNILRAGTVENCSSFSDSYYQSGIVHIVYSGTIANCSSYGSIQNSFELTTDNAYMGGIVDQISDIGTANISECENYASITGPGAVGGITGNYSGALGGLVSSSLIDCANYGNISADFAGGIVGEVQTSGQILKSANFGDISGQTAAGGIISVSSNGGSISNCYNTGDVFASPEIFASENPALEGAIFAGGIAGVTGYGTYDEEEFGNTVYATKITNCYNRGEIVSLVGAGGIVGGNGMAYQSQILNCFNIGKVSVGLNAVEPAVRYLTNQSTIQLSADKVLLEQQKANELAVLEEEYMEGMAEIESYEAEIEMQIAYTIENLDQIIAEEQARIEERVQQAIADGATDEEAAALREQLEDELQQNIDSLPEMFAQMRAEIQAEKDQLNQAYQGQIEQINLKYDPEIDQLDQQINAIFEQTEQFLQENLTSLQEKVDSANAELLSKSTYGGIIGVQTEMLDSSGASTTFYGNSQNSYYGGLCENIGGVQGEDTESIFFVDNIAELAKEADWYSSEIWEENNAWRMGFDWQFVEGENDGYPVFAEASSWENFVDTDFAGEGTETNPYLITSAEELAGLAYLVNNGTEDYASANYLQTTNINLGSHYWEPIGFAEDFPFMGNYDGGNHTVSGLIFDETQQLGTCGLFGIVAINQNGETIEDMLPEIKNLGITGPTITFYGMSNGAIIGGAVGSSEDIGVKLTNCYNEADLEVRGTMAYVGGLFGSLGYLSISDCFNAGDIAGGDVMSMIFGIGMAGTGVVGDIKNVNNFGDINGLQVYGLLAIYNFQNGITIENCHNYGTLSATAAIMPLFYIGNASNASNETVNLTFKNCGNSGTLNFLNEDCFALPMLSMSMGTSNNTTDKNVLIENCYNTADLFLNVTGSNRVCGTFFGFLDDWNVTIKNCFSTGNITSNVWVGGFIGSANQITITGSYFSGRIESFGDNGDYSGVAGLVVNANSAIIENCYFNGQLVALGAGGGLIGVAENATVSNSYVFAQIEQTSNTGNNAFTIGGIVLNITGSATLTNNFVFANLSSTQTVGGLIGGSTASEITIENCVFEGNITVTDSTTDTYAGGFIGSATGCSNLSITGSYINTDITVATTNAYASGMIGSITMSDTSSPAAIDKCAVVANISTSAEGEMTNSREFYFSPNLVDSATILNSYALFNNSLTISDTTTGMDGYFAYLDNFQNGLPIPIGLYYITSYGTTTGIADQLQKFVG